MTHDDTKPVKQVNTDALLEAVTVRDQQREAFKAENKLEGKNRVGTDRNDGEQDEEEPQEVTTLSSCVELNIDDEEVYYVGTAGVKVTDLDGLENLPRLQRLHVRSNLLQSMASVASLINLEHLELYDNQIQALEGVEKLVNLKVLDLSFNEIRVIPDLSHLTKLEELYVANNKLKKITGLEKLSTLKKLDLGANRLRVIEGIDGLTQLEQLWLGKNKITAIQGLDHLTKLKIISVQSNRVVKIEGFANNLDLEELYLSHNGIEKIENMEQLANLTTVDLGANRITTIPTGLAALTLLEDLWINDNQVSHYADVENLIPLAGLRTLYLERNPLAQDFEYRKKLEALLPELDQIDATPTTKARRGRG
ncbi:hypothetical protein BBP00_00005928 [Phytophthora kernoviae]|uniref:Protein phosphatase 1 regulatory subunit 7 n=1 Tax=Phytophthora kernoviae TaxID=325452 RepID=A0A3F2RMJ2_9STRA|nr:hypothetical protein BBP00_00005928 [Phytophthora kernoviae]